jgi:rfaE bifunctional protein nucleotidyltransferase chain/domain
LLLEFLAWRIAQLYSLAETSFMSVEKILQLSELAVRSDALRAAEKQLVFTNGCFDLLHVGHVRYLQAARRCGDALAVALNGDTSVRTLKGPTRPINCEADRAEVLAGLECVDFVVCFHTPRVDAVIRQVRPAIYVKGGDYTLETLDPDERAALESVGARIEIVGLVPGKSTTAVVQKMAGDVGAEALK